MTCYLKLPLLLPRAHIRQLGAFILYLTTDLPSLNYLDRYSFSILQHQFKHGMIQIILLDHPSKSRTSAKLFTDVFLHTNMGPLHHQSKTYLELPLPIMKHETYWYRRLTLIIDCCRLLLKGDRDKLFIRKAEKVFMVLVWKWMKNGAVSFKASCSLLIRGWCS